MVFKTVFQRTIRRTAGGFEAADYTPGNAAAVKEKGMAIPKLPDDEKGLMNGMDVATDYLGNPITGMPDIGAIEMQ